MLRCGICDDRREDLAAIQACAAAFSRRYPRFPLQVEAFASGYDLLEAVQRGGGCDLYLLDVLLPGLNGIDLARRLRERGERAELIFLTVSREYAVEAFGVRASGYLLKPVKQAEFDREVLRCAQNLAPERHPALLLKTPEGLRRVALEELVLVESFDHSRVCTLASGEALRTTATLSSLYERLRAYPGFFQPHRAYIVNLAYVRSLGAGQLTLAEGRRVPVSRGAAAALKQAYLEFAF